MNPELILEPPPAYMARACAFTLATALVWMGHECTGGCPTQTLELPADVWFIHDPAAAGEDHLNTRVVVRFGPTPTTTGSRHRGLLRHVNDCVRRDHIHVRERKATSRDSTLTVAAVTAWPASPLPTGDRRGRRRAPHPPGLHVGKAAPGARYPPRSPWASLPDQCLAIAPDPSAVDLRAELGLITDIVERGPLS